MNVTGLAANASTLVGGFALAGLLGLGLGSAAAAPGQPCGAPNTPACQGAPGPGGSGNPGQGGWQNRSMDQGRADHQPFNYNGQQVHPLPAGNGDGWGFWFLGRWIRL
ncbi:MULTISPECIES: hypothetical protein [Mycolicibacterium]|uniref:Uncharacterized protein n=1 Tax=Mycolicibacterium poriferae TaxID=39694 RepID=A0A6N4VH29_9MYCO|nr:MULTISPECIES: hypothetical protein [Mycolicibacterium]MCG7582582.1 hypothetical protein [Mycolicibacterium sp. OfavD-34-C]MCV7261542.1 hypothetical protein [Mycolicibacterium poriferae]QFS93270.1 hypothetical protein FIV07_21110 [Mycobacterium sp. THAF192]BBX53739.1 hypothetical protein MPOR_47650 [Mycolicibacterium poriferae]